jgi:hypothetical protein
MVQVFDLAIRMVKQIPVIIIDDKPTIFGVILNRATFSGWVCVVGKVPDSSQTFRETPD